MQIVHHPKTDADLAPNATYMAKLAYCELLAHQSAIAISRKNRLDIRNRRSIRPVKYQLMEKFWRTLPFEMTGPQKRTCDEIFDDMTKSIPMMRLVQGDVGSGKTMVAAAAAYMAVKNGHQAAMMAPTEILAEQHFASLHKLFEPMGITVGLLTGSMTVKQKRILRAVCQSLHY